MADILIRGMEMPNNVFDCPLNSFGICNLAQDETHCNCIGDSRPEWCPLLPLPEGHGRLIDADAMERNMSETVQGDIRGYPYSDTQWDMAFRWIDHQPTIVPAEGGNDDA